MELIISHTSTLKPAFPMFLISVNDTSTHSLSYLNQKLCSLPVFPKSQLLSYHLDKFLPGVSRLQGQECSLPHPPLRNVFAASNPQDKEQACLPRKISRVPQLSAPQMQPNPLPAQHPSGPLHVTPVGFAGKGNRSCHLLRRKSSDPKVLCLPPAFMKQKQANVLACEQDRDTA